MSKSDTPFGLPTLSDSIFDRSALLSSMAWANLRSIVLRSAGVVWDHESKAARAAETALSTSASVPFGTSPIVSSVAGFVTENVSPSAASDQSPLMNMRWRVAVSVIEKPLVVTRWVPVS